MAGGDGPAQEGDGDPRQRPWWRRVLPRSALRHPIRRTVVVVLLLLVFEYLILPQVAGVHKSLYLLGRIKLDYVALGLLAEAASLVCYAQLTRAVLPHKAIGLSRVLRIDLATLAISHVLPGGTAGGEGLAYKLLLDEGVNGSDAGFALATQALGSAVVLNVILWLALIVSIPLTGFNPLYGLAAAVGGAAFALFAAAVLLLTRGEDRAARILHSLASRLPFMRNVDMDRLVHDLADRLRAMASDRPLMIKAVGWAALNWLLDASALFIFLAAFGHLENPDGLLVAYGLAYVLSAIPISPGGLGIVEGVLVPTLVGFGSPRGVAVLGVVAYRLVNFWLPIPVGAASYLSVKRHGGGEPARRRSEELRQALEEAAAAQAAHPMAEDGFGPAGTT